MKKAIMALGYAFLALLVGILAGVGTLAIKGNALDKESKAYVDAVVPAIVAEWDVSEIQKRASPEFNDEVDYGELEQFFGDLQGLGKLEQYKGSSGDSNITLSLHGCEITADYDASADFEGGSADIRIALIRHDGAWQILDLKVNPEEYSKRNDII